MTVHDHRLPGHDKLSQCLARSLDRRQPTQDPEGWAVSGTGAVWTEVYATDATGTERRAQVIAFGTAFFLLVARLDDLYDAGSFAELAELWRELNR